MTADNMFPSTTGDALLLRPRVNELVTEFLSDRIRLRQLVEACGSPLSVLFPQLMEPNLRAFEEILEKHKLTGKIFFAHKTNQSNSLTGELAITNAGVDVASIKELQHALASGFAGSRLEATGPKNRDFIYLCLMHEVVINVDCLQEIDIILELRRALGCKTRTQILLRLCDFEALRSQILSKQSRFGTRVRDLPTVLSVLEQCRAEIDVLGFAFHLDSSSLNERVLAIENCMQAIEQALDLGFDAHVINIGGHFRINYLADENDWHRYTNAINQAALGIGPQVTWQNNYFGLSAHAGTLRGKFNSYGYFEPTPGAVFLDKLLDSEVPAYEHQKLAHLLRDNMIELWLEPGRALLDQAGLTLAEVTFVKTTSLGEKLLVLDMKRSDIAYLDQEVFVDPILISNKGSKVKYSTEPLRQEPSSAYVPVYIAGNLCLEGDLIYRHLTYLPFLPEPGDLLAFVNTAAYMMDFSATESIMQPRAERIAMLRTESGFRWYLDEHYSPLRNLIAEEK